MNPNPNTASVSTPVPAPSTSAPEVQHVPVLPSADLLRGQKVVAIDHNGSLYRLQTTRQGKLILTK
ncbi:hemin uptake protein HemP [Hydrogenophaga sp. 2FB]|uniref:hemin uptake protein HemP n=1 Tax=Hydrogenophaga sp. 2FB TaxID=2502187 RepID=UPI0010F4D360|nr:hemin uptake protein HemP [Hydrogenophaga sp. 2FB]